MENQKLDSALNMFFSLSETEQKSWEASFAGLEEGIFEVILRYHGDIRQYREEYRQIAELLADYAIVWIPAENLERFSQHPEVEYVEKPKELSFSVDHGRRASCMLDTGSGNVSGSGAGVFVGIVDSGIDFSHGDFRNADGSSRIFALWDQSARYLDYDEGGEEEIQRYGVGRLYRREKITEALLQPDRQKRQSIVPELDLSGHGTAVAGIAAGNGRESGGRYRGVAPESSLLVVKLRAGRSEGFSNTGSLMMGVDFCIRMARENRIPLALNLSLGTTFGAHNGMSLLERYLDDVSLIGRNVICIGTGNEGNTSGHAEIRLMEEREERIELSVSAFEQEIVLQIWQYYPDVFFLGLISPSGKQSEPFVDENRILTFGSSRVSVFFGEPGPYSPYREILLHFYGVGSDIERGIWQLVFVPGRIVLGRVELWLPSEASLNYGTQFLRPSVDTTLTIPSTAMRAISVAAYDPVTLRYADFSGRGFPWANVTLKPDLSAPGVGIVAPARNGGYDRFSGTSFSTPFVTGAAALLMEEGIVKGKDPYLYGEKVKAVLTKRAVRLPFQENVPDARAGWGALCL